MNNNKILFVVTSHDKLGDTGKPTGYYLSEVSHPWDVLSTAGYTIDFASPKGGKPPVDAMDLKDPINKKFWDSPDRMRLEKSMTPAQVNPDDYAAIFYAGGHGAMWDFPDNPTLQALTLKIYDNGGVVSAVCHGPAALTNIKLNNGKYFVEGKNVSAFTDAEEQAAGTAAIMPFLLQDKLQQRGANFKEGTPFTKEVTPDERLVTGQNPQSATGVGEAIKSALAKLKKPQPAL